MFTCPYCVATFTSFPAYETHKAHGHRSIVVPERVTKRSKAEIVQNAEATWLAPFIVTSDGSEHLPACRCYACVQKAFDRLVEESERLIVKPSEVNPTNLSLDDPEFI
jgi:uncharacterized C2H2 Zn-finger protein